MFTIKLYNDQDHYNVVTCPHYNVSRFKTEEGMVIEITLYKDFTTQEGVTYRVANEISTPHWRYAYIENCKGKTIDHIKPDF